ncbi:MAG: SirB2 family protein [Halofilum sp. (in: g-proteobacteria)]
MIDGLRHLHFLMAGLSMLGFLLRGLWAWLTPGLLARKPVKILPHVIDTLLLASAIALLFAYGWNPFAQAWLVAKIVLLIVYIGLGLVALKPWYGASVRVPAFFAAVAVFAWIVAIALSKLVLPFA